MLDFSLFSECRILRILVRFLRSTLVSSTQFSFQTILFCSVFFSSSTHSYLPTFLLRLLFFITILFCLPFPSSSPVSNISSTVHLDFIFLSPLHSLLFSLPIFLFQNAWAYFHISRLFLHSRTPLFILSLLVFLFLYFLTLFHIFFVCLFVSWTL